MIIRFLAVIAGLVAILAPLASLIIASKQTKGRESGSGSFLRRVPGSIAVTVWLVLIGLIFWIPLPVRFPGAADAILLGMGSILYFPAIALYLWGLAALGKQFGVSTAAGADLYLDHQLVRKGPYRWIRHPMYLAVLLAAAGALLIFRTWAMLVFTPLSLVVIRRAASEEALLAEEFPEEWGSYIQEVPPWLPRCYKKGSS